MAKNNEDVKCEENEILDEQINVDEDVCINDENNCTEAQEDSCEEKVDTLQKLEEKEKEANEYLELLKRTKAEFDNYRKRTIKEKESMYNDGYADLIKDILPVLDNLERALEYNNNSEDSFVQGVEMVMKMFKETLQKSGLEEIIALNEKFNPDYHNAVMHIEDDEKEENIVVEVLQKGYKYKGKIIRYSMVKVAN